MLIVLMLLLIGHVLPIRDRTDRTPFAACDARGWRAGKVNCVMFSADGLLLRASGLEGSFVVWDVAARQVRAMSRGRGGNGSRAVLDRDGRSLAVDNRDRTVTLVDLATGQRRADLPAHAEAVFALAFSRDGTVIASADDSGVRLWESATGRLLPGPGLALGGIRCLAFAPDGQALAASDIDGRIRIIDLRTGREGVSFQAHSGPLSSLSYSDDGRMLASTSMLDEVARLWEAGGGRPLLELKGNSRRVHAAAFAPGGRTVATAGTDGRVRLWDVPSGRLLETLSCGNASATVVAFSPDGRTLAGATSESILVWNTERVSGPTARVN
jgi:WD40 repeat protein